MKKQLFIAIAICVAIQSYGQVNTFGSFGENRMAQRKERVAPHSPEAYQLLEYAVTQQSKYGQVKGKQNIDADKAEIILEAHNVWGAADMGYQMILDADHTAYGTIFYEFSGAFYGTYDDFEYKIPTNADASATSKNFVKDGAVSIEIPAGVYDFAILLPNWEELAFAKGEFAKYDDFEFKGGCSYRFLVNMRMGDEGYSQDFVDLYTDVDAALTALVLPPNSMDMTNAEDIKVTIANNGKNEITGYSVSYQVDDNAVVTETVTEAIASGAKLDYTFTTKADLSAEKIYNVKAWVTLDGDMLAGNDTITGKCKHIGVAPTPYIYSFSAAGKDAFVSDWTVIDGNGDNTTWYYNEWNAGVSGDMGTANCGGAWQGDMTSNDWLISSPISLKAGANHIIFYTKCINSETTELLEVLVGTSTETAEMTVVGDYQVNYDVWTKKVINFTVEADGTYYIAFHNKSVSGLNVFVDEITVDTGEFLVSPELKVAKVLLPYSNCDLSDQSKVGAIIRNEGTGTSSTFTLIYSINGDANTAVSQEFTLAIEPAAQDTVYFDTPADFAEVGEYEVLVEVKTGAEVEHANMGVVNNFEPLALPVTTDFTVADEYKNVWTELSEGMWQFDSNFSEFGSTGYTGIEAGLLSRCIHLEGPARLLLAIAGGGMYDYPGYYVAFGKAGADPATYEVLYRNDNLRQVEQIEIYAPVTTPDDYSFIIVPTVDHSSIKIYQTVISAVLDYDIRLDNVSVSVSSYTPADQVKGVGVYEATVINRGLAAMKGVKTSLYHGETLLGTTEQGVDIEPNDTAVVVVKAQLPELAVGETIKLSMQVIGETTDEYMDDNTYTLPTVNVTEAQRSTENLNDFYNGTGAYGSQLFVGNVYYLAEPDTLTSVTIGFSNSDDVTIANYNIGAAVYSLKEDGKTIDRVWFEKTFKRGNGGLVEINTDPIYLPAGKYYIEVQQLETQNMGLGCDPDSESLFCYQNNNGVLTEVLGMALAVRANFASGQAVYEKDAQVVDFVAPAKRSALYSSDETFSVLVKNNGIQAGAFTVTLNVAGIEKTAQVEMLSYETRVVDFENFDLYTAGDYLAVATVTMEGDMNPDNDKLEVTFVAREEANPYVMDFESCDDFDAAGDIFNPRWRTVDRAGIETDYYWQYNYPHRGEPVGFIAFNPDLTVPSMTENEFEGFIPHSGDRFGAAFNVGYNNDIVEADTWLISPKLSLGDESSLELFVRGRFNEYGNSSGELYRILISETDDNFESFVVLGDDVRTAPYEWTKVEIDLADYNNKDVYVAIQYISTMGNGLVALMVDDIHVKSTIASVDAIDANKEINVWYNKVEEMLSVTSPAGINRIEVYNIQGQTVYTATVGERDVYRFSVSGFAAGVYVAKVYTETGCATRKLMVK